MQYIVPFQNKHIAYKAHFYWDFKACFFWK